MRGVGRIPTPKSKVKFLKDPKEPPSRHLERWPSRVPLMPRMCHYREPRTLRLPDWRLCRTKNTSSRTLRTGGCEDFRLKVGSSIHCGCIYRLTCHLVLVVAWDMFQRMGMRCACRNEAFVQALWERGASTTLLPGAGVREEIAAQCSRPRLCVACVDNSGTLDGNVHNVIAKISVARVGLRLKVLSCPWNYIYSMDIFMSVNVFSLYMVFNVTNMRSIYQKP